MKLKPKILILFLFFVFLLTAGLKCKISEPKVEDLESAALTIWGVWEKEKDLNDIIKEFQAQHPNVTVSYRQFRYSEYEKQILSAMANRQEPDIIFIHNTWLGNYLNKIVSMPPEIKTTTVTMEGVVKKEKIIKTEKISTPSLKNIKDTYLSVVYDDVVREIGKKGSKVYSLPLYVDTLVLFYNKDILENSGILDPPLTWEEFQQDVRLITHQDANNRIIQSGAALGTANNIERYFDILSLLMMQLGSPMVDGRSISFNAAKQGGSSTGADALRFYTDFAFQNKDVYTWNKSMTNSIDEFAAGKVAFIFGYSYHIDQIRKKNPKLNFDIAKVPQARADKEVNYASYWMPVVLDTSKNSDEAWNFITYASSPDVVDSFLESSKRPPAIKKYLIKYKEDFDLAPFVSQLLTAKSWYKGKKANDAEMAFERMINKVLAVEEEENFEKVLIEAVQSAASEVGKGY
jgi:multiple sugar transport system substrate-binding protein